MLSLQPIREVAPSDAKRALFAVYYYLHAKIADRQLTFLHHEKRCSHKHTHAGSFQAKSHLDTRKGKIIHVCVCECMPLQKQQQQQHQQLTAQSRTINSCYIHRAKEAEKKNAELKTPSNLCVRAENNQHEKRSNRQQRVHGDTTIANAYKMKANE